MNRFKRVMLFSRPKLVGTPSPDFDFGIVEFLFPTHTPTRTYNTVNSLNSTIFSSSYTLLNTIENNSMACHQCKCLNERCPVGCAVASTIFSSSYTLLNTIENNLMACHQSKCLNERCPVGCAVASRIAEYAIFDDDAFHRRWDDRTPGGAHRCL